MRGPDEAPKICTVLFVHSIWKKRPLDRNPSTSYEYITLNNGFLSSGLFFLMKSKNAQDKKKGTLQKTQQKMQISNGIC